MQTPHWQTLRDVLDVLSRQPVLKTGAFAVVFDIQSIILL
jgi:hypothetical protein